MQLRVALLVSLSLGCGSSDSAVDARASFVGIAHAGFYEESQDEAFAWYRDVLGLQPEGSHGFALEDGAQLSVLAGGMASAPKDTSQQSIVVALQVAKLDATMALLQQRGVELTGDAQTESGVRSAEFTDWEGNRTQLRQLAQAGDDFENMPWACVYVADLAASAAWYAKLLDTPAAAISGDPSRKQLRLKDGAVIELRSGGIAAASAKTAMQQSVVLGLSVSDVDDAIADLRSRGIDVSDGSSPALIDPEGNQWMISAPR